MIPKLKYKINRKYGVLKYIKYNVDGLFNPYKYLNIYLAHKDKYLNMKISWTVIIIGFILFEI